MLKTFLQDKRGNVAMMFAIALIPLVAATGGAIDFSRAYKYRTVVQDALDAAALAANRKIGAVPEAQVKAEAANFFAANTAGRLPAPIPINVTLAGSELTARATLTVDTYLLGIVGLDQLTFNLMSKTVAAAQTFEVALVLDNSTSMSGTKISSLRTAATNLVNTLFAATANSTIPQPMKIALVPFGASVKVGTNYENAGWMDTQAKSPIHSEDFESWRRANGEMSSINRFELYDAMTRVDWAGCVESRPSPYDVDDTPPTTSDPATLFVPNFEPDEPDRGDYDNNYLSDSDTDSCSGVGQTTSSTSARDTNGQPRAQARTCKYYTTDRISSGGPNKNCTTAALTPLTTNQSTVLSRISAMQANGLTNIPEGIAWGFRALSPTEPLTEGRPYVMPPNETPNNKFMIVMTDGDNTYNVRNNINKSMHGTFGYFSKGRLGSSTGGIVSRMNEKTAAVCENAKAAGIRIYTIAFQISNPDTRQMLIDCASETTMAYRSDSNSQLIAAFQQIAQEMSKLRIAE